MFWFKQVTQVLVSVIIITLSWIIIILILIIIIVCQLGVHMASLQKVGADIIARETGCKAECFFPCAKTAEPAVKISQN